VAILGIVGLLVYVGLNRGVTESIRADSPVVTTTVGSLIGYWKFDDTDDSVFDSSGENNNGVYVNSTQTRGRFGQALRLSGDNNSHVSIPATASLGKFSDQITVSAWVLPSRAPKDYRVVVSRQIGTLMHPDQFYLGFGPQNGRIRYKWHLGTIENGTVNDRSIYTGHPIAGHWINMTGIYDGKMMRLYIDGLEIGSREQTGKIQVDDNPVTIGAEENGAESRIVEGEFDGLIDEVRIYSRVLSPTEIKAISNQHDY